jgi:hypothetical protein
LGIIDITTLTTRLVAKSQRFSAFSFQLRTQGAAMLTRISSEVCEP